MNRKHIAVIFGGCSPEHGVSLASAAGILQHLDRSRFLPVLIGITKQGDWYLFEGDVSRVADGSWERGRCTPACLSPNRGRHELLVFRETGVAHIPIDAAFPVLHGRNGEDGTVQGLCELAGIPLAGCGTLASALCMDKDRAHKLVSLSGVRVPNSCVLHTGDDAQFAEKAAEALGYPLFVKPVKAGSSFGVARITAPDALGSAVEAAFYYDDRVLLEEAIPGFEVGCAVMGGDQLTLGEPDEKGRRSPVGTGKFETIEVDSVLAAVGQSIDWGGLDIGELKTGKKGNAIADPVTYQTEQKDIFVGGDVYTGPKFAIDAIAAGREGAESLHRFVNDGQSLTVGRNLREFYELDTKTFEHDRLTFTEDQVKAEASRCLGCGVSVVDPNRCIGCGLCTTKCMFDAIHLHRDVPAASNMVRCEDKVGPMLKHAAKQAIKIKRKA